MASSHISKAPICPKCGYDQSGEIATWEDQCPLEGRCPECGLEFSWANVLVPNLIDLPWFVEHAKTKREMLRRTIPTLWMLMIPNRYWHRVTMETGRSLRRYTLWIVLMMLVLHIVSSLALLAAIHGHTLSSNAYYTQWLNAGKTEERRAMIRDWIIDTSLLDYWWPIIGEAVLHPAVARSINTGEISEVAGMFAMACASISATWFLLFCMFPVTRARMKLRMVHVARAMVVVGLLPFLIFELARFAAAAIYVGEYWAPLANVEMVINLVILLLIVWMFVWVQWFWISAVWIGWKVKARWFEMILVTTASFLGIVSTGIIHSILLHIGEAINAIATWAGI